MNIIIENLKEQINNYILEHTDGKIFDIDENELFADYNKPIFYNHIVDNFQEILINIFPEIKFKFSNDANLISDFVQTKNGCVNNPNITKNIHYFTIFTNYNMIIKIYYDFVNFWQGGNYSPPNSNIFIIITNLDTNDNYNFQFVTKIISSAYHSQPEHYWHYNNGIINSEIKTSHKKDNHLKNDIINFFKEILDTKSFTKQIHPIVYIDYIINKYDYTQVKKLFLKINSFEFDETKKLYAIKSNEYDKLKIEYDNIINTLNTKDNEIIKLIEQNLQHEKKIKTCEMELKKLEQLNVYKMKIDELSNQNKILECKNKVLDEKLNGCNETNINMENKHNQLKNDYEEINKLNEILKKQNETIQNELNELKKKYSLDVKNNRLSFQEKNFQCIEKNSSRRLLF